MIYLDNNATTRSLPEVVDAMLSVMRDGYANPSSVHQFGQAARHVVECAREQVAALIGSEPKEIIFTSSGTEAINLAIRGMLAGEGRSKRFLTTTVEHAATLRVGEQLAREGYTVDYVGVDQDGRIDETEWAEKLTDETGLASILHANNETGVVCDVARLSAMAADRGVPVHVDAVQSTGKLPIDVKDWPVQLVSLSGHKFHGPKGAGALYLKRRTRLTPMLLGGLQERKLRSGTENVPAIVGLGCAAKLAMRSGAEVAEQVGRLRDRLEAGLLNRLSYAHVNGSPSRRIYNTSNISFAGLEAEAILLLLSEAGICASSGSACSSGSLEPSHVLKAMGVDPHIAHGSIRFSLSRFNTVEEIDEVLNTVPDLLARLTALGGR